MLPMLGLALLTLTLSRCTVAFVPIGGDATHTSITETALLDIVRETCRDVVKSGGDDFEPTVRRTIPPELRGQTLPTPSHHLYIMSFMVTAKSQRVRFEPLWSFS